MIGCATSRDELPSWMHRELTDTLTGSPMPAETFESMDSISCLEQIAGTQRPKVNVSVYSTLYAAAIVSSQDPAAVEFARSTTGGLVAYAGSGQ